MPNEDLSVEIAMELGFVLLIGGDKCNDGFAHQFVRG
jgi:hypothetical protein